MIDYEIFLYFRDKSVKNLGIIMFIVFKKGKMYTFSKVKQKEFL